MTKIRNIEANRGNIYNDKDGELAFVDIEFKLRITKGAGFSLPFSHLENLCYHLEASTSIKKIILKKNKKVIKFRKKGKVTEKDLKAVRIIQAGLGLYQPILKKEWISAVNDVFKYSLSYCALSKGDYTVAKLLLGLYESKKDFIEKAKACGCYAYFEDLEEKPFRPVRDRHCSIKIEPVEIKPFKPAKDTSCSIKVEPVDVDLPTVIHNRLKDDNSVSEEIKRLDKAVKDCEKFKKVSACHHLIRITKEMYTISLITSKASALRKYAFIEKNLDVIKYYISVVGGEIPALPNNCKFRFVYDALLAMKLENRILKLIEE